MIIFVDLDGVLVNMPKAVADVFGKDWDEMEENWNLGNPDIENELGISKSEFWKTINQYPTFWENLEPYDHVAELLDILKGHTVKILTSPSLDTKCASGKMKWIQKYVPHLVPHTIICRDKFLLAKSGRILLDDTDKKVKAWDEADIEAFSITFPQPWNKNFMYRNDKLQYVKNQLHLIRDIYEHR